MQTVARYETARSVSLAKSSAKLYTHQHIYPCFPNDPLQKFSYPPPSLSLYSFLCTSLPMYFDTRPGKNFPVQLVPANSDLGLCIYGQCSTNGFRDVRYSIPFHFIQPSSTSLFYFISHPLKNPWITGHRKFFHLPPPPPPKKKVSFLFVFIFKNDRFFFKNVFSHFSNQLQQCVHLIILRKETQT